MRNCRKGWEEGMRLQWWQQPMQIKNNMNYRKGIERAAPDLLDSTNLLGSVLSFLDLFPGLLHLGSKSILTNTNISFDNWLGKTKKCIKWGQHSNDNHISSIHVQVVPTNENCAGMQLNFHRFGFNFHTFPVLSKTARPLRGQRSGNTVL